MLYEKLTYESYWGQEAYDRQRMERELTLQALRSSTPFRFVEANMNRFRGVALVGITLGLMAYDFNHQGRIIQAFHHLEEMFLPGPGNGELAVLYAAYVGPGYAITESCRALFHRLKNGNRARQSTRSYLHSEYHL